MKQLGYVLAVHVFLSGNVLMAQKAQFTPLVCPTVKEMEQGLARWQKRYPEALRVESVGKTPGGRDVLLCRITDFAVPDDDKQVVLLTSCHGAMEKNAVTSLLHLIKWLISSDPVAREVRKRQIVLVMPCNNPDGYEKGQRLRDVYMCWDWNGVTDRKRHPEAAILQRVIDAYRQEVHVDLHGFSLAEQMMWESTAISWGAAGYGRSYLPEIPTLMNEAAERAGFLITMGEQSEGKLLATAPVPGADEHFYLRRGAVNDCVYSYHQYHTWAFTMEIGFEQ
ncbi:MAG: M14 family zinc carboxypeptidase, partial [Alphaproteobacteria bacterium]